MANGKKVYRTVGGTLGKMELKELATGKTVLNFGIGVNIDPSQEQFQWVNCKAWEGTGDAILSQCQKGDKIIVNGPMDEWNERWSLTVYDWAKLDRKPRESKPSPGYERLSDRSGADDEGIPF